MFYLKTKECRDALKGYESVRAMGSTDALVRGYQNIPYSHSQRQGGVTIGCTKNEVRQNLSWQKHLQQTHWQEVRNRCRDSVDATVRSVWNHKVTTGIALILNKGSFFCGEQREKLPLKFLCSFHISIVTKAKIVLISEYL